MLLLYVKSVFFVDSSKQVYHKNDFSSEVQTHKIKKMLLPIDILDFSIVLFGSLISNQFNHVYVEAIVRFSRHVRVKNNLIRLVFLILMNKDTTPTESGLLVVYLLLLFVEIEANDL